MPSIAIPVSLRGQLLNSVRAAPAAFSPSTLFALNEPGVWYDPSDLTTLFQDPAGTLPVTTPGQTVALALDKSKGLVLGSELVTNGDFSSGTGWSTGGGWTISSGAASIASSGNLTQNALALLAQNKLVKVTYTITSAFSGSGVAPFFQQTSPTSINVFGTYRTAVGTYTEYLQAPLNATVFGFNSGSTSGSINNISVKELPGFHATQATLASRPTYGIVPLGGRRNLLTRTEEFENAGWSKLEATIVANSGSAPDGTATADKLIPTTTNNVHYARQVSTVTNTTHTYTLYAKADGYNFVNLQLANSGSYGKYFEGVFNLSTGAVESTGRSFIYTGSRSITPIGTTGWYRCQIVVNSIDANSTTVAVVLPLTTNDPTATYSGNGTSGILIWGAQLETGSSATAYQRVGSAFDVTEAGVASLSYLSFDGVDDFLITPTITPGIDKVTVGAGVRKLNDTVSIIAETGTNADGNAGSFYFVSGLNNGAIGNVNGYTSKSRGSTGGLAAQVQVNAPDTAVLAITHDIAGDLSTMRRNAVAGTNSTSDQGTGNFLAYPLYIGRRGGTTLPFNGQLYSLVVRFAATDLATVGQLESWINGKTGAYS